MELEKDTLGFEIQMSDDRLSGSIKIYEEFPSQSFTYEQLKNYILGSGIQQGILEDVVNDIVVNPYSYTEKITTIAKGVEPINGADSYEEIVYKDSETKKGPALLEDGRVDHHEINQIENVVSGQLLLVKIPATKGTNGVGIDGRVIPARDGKDKQLKVGKNVQLSDDKLQIFAAIDGQVSFTENNVINVFPLYEVKGDVDYSVGNINFLGSIVVNGNVFPGFKITAAGDVRVRGSVEGAEIKAEGSIEIAAGVIGHNKAYIMAGMDIKTNFAQEATLIAKQDVVVTQSIIHCNVQAGGHIKCPGQKGLIVGGKLQANTGIVAKTIGNSMSTSTTLEVGAMPELRINMNAVMEKMSAVHTSLVKTEQAITILEQMLHVHGSLPPDKQALLIKLSNTKDSLLLEKKMHEEKQAELELAWQEIDQASVVATIVYPGVKITIGKAIKYIIHEMNNCHFVYDSGDVINRAEVNK